MDVNVFVGCVDRSMCAWAARSQWTLNTCSIDCMHIVVEIGWEKQILAGLSCSCVYSMLTTSCRQLDDDDTVARSYLDLCK